jgi:hypothetical protein
MHTKTDGSYKGLGWVGQVGMPITWSPCLQHLVMCPCLQHVVMFARLVSGGDKGTLCLPDVVLCARLADGDDLGPLLTICS